MKRGFQCKIVVGVLYTLLLCSVPSDCLAGESATEDRGLLKEFHLSSASIDTSKESFDYPTDDRINLVFVPKDPARVAESRWYDPDGEEFRTIRTIHDISKEAGKDVEKPDGDRPRMHTMATKELHDHKPGIWKVELSLDGRLAGRKTFLLRTSSSEAPQPASFDCGKEAVDVENKPAAKEQSTPSPTDTKVPFPATRYPFLPSLIEDREPGLCAIILKGVLERFNSSDLNPRMTGQALSGITWLEWEKFGERGHHYRLDLDLDGTGRIQPVVGRSCFLPHGIDSSEFFVFSSVDSFNKAAGEPGWLGQFPGCAYIYETPRSTDDPVMYHPTGLVAGDERKEVGTGEDWEDHRLFRWRSRYYSFDEQPPRTDLNMDRLTTYRLQADGKVDPLCVVCLFPDKESNQSFRKIPGISSFLKVLSTIGNEGERCPACMNHEGGANAAVYRATYRPWAASRATSVAFLN